MNKIILLVEDKPSDEKQMLLAFKNCGVANQIVVARDGAAAIRTKLLPGVTLTSFKELAAQALGSFWLLLNEPSPALRPTP